MSDLVAAIPLPEAKPQNAAGLPNVKLTRQLAAVEKSPVMILNEIKPGLSYECTSSSGESYAKFTMSVCIDNKNFEGTGESSRVSTKGLEN